MEATTILYPATQSNVLSRTSNEVSPGLIVAVICVQVTGLSFPHIENLHSLQIIPLFPNIGNCLPWMFPYRVNFNLLLWGFYLVPALNSPWLINISPV